MDKLKILLTLLLFINIVNNAFAYNPIEECLGNGPSGVRDTILCPLLATTAVPAFTLIVIPSLATDSLTKSFRRKLIVQAKPDAYFYVSSNGEYHGVYLEQAINQIKLTYPDYSDMDIAKAIIAY